MLSWNSGANTPVRAAIVAKRPEYRPYKYTTSCHETKLKHPHDHCDESPIVKLIISNHAESVFFENEIRLTKRENSICSSPGHGQVILGHLCSIGISLASLLGRLALLITAAELCDVAVIVSFHLLVEYLSPLLVVCPQTGTGINQSSLNTCNHERFTRCHFAWTDIGFTFCTFPSFLSVVKRM